jgi:serine/threonine protein phosphatase PrpC
MVRTIVLRNFDYASHTDRGRVRDRNEDFISYYDTVNGHAFVVCDGMGGHNAGDVASELAVESIKEFLNEKYYPNPFEAVENAILYANKIIYNHALGNDYLLGMGTTIVLVLVRDDKVYYGHAGDSRLYLYRNHVLDQMTEDHSIVQQLLKAGLISLSEAEDHPKRHEITRALGLSLTFEPDVSPRAIVPQNEDFLLMCTDGLTNLLEHDDISKILDNPFNLNDKASKLIGKANRRGGTDNISVILIRFHNLDEQEEIQEIVQDKAIIGQIRSLLRNRNFSFLLVFLFVLGTSFFVFNHREKELIFPEKQIINTIKEKEQDLIIPYRQKEEETLDQVAEKFNIDIETIIKLNPNYNKNNAGGHLKIPVRDLYIVKHDDRLELLAAIYGIPVIDILKANDLGGLHTIVGTELIIPLKRFNNK